MNTQSRARSDQPTGTIPTTIRRYATTRVVVQSINNTQWPSLCELLPDCLSNGATGLRPGAAIGFPPEAATKTLLFHPYPKINRAYIATSPVLLPSCVRVLTMFLAKVRVVILRSSHQSKKHQSLPDRCGYLNDTSFRNVAADWSYSSPTALPVEYIPGTLHRHSTIHHAHISARLSMRNPSKVAARREC